MYMCMWHMCVCMFSMYVYTHISRWILCNILPKWDKILLQGLPVWMGVTCMGVTKVFSVLQSQEKCSLVHYVIICDWRLHNRQCTGYCQYCSTIALERGPRTVRHLDIFYIQYLSSDATWLNHGFLCFSEARVACFPRTGHSRV